ncbi:MAG TPA: hypothetical protein VEI03_05855 [Stellaceae bacterium]|nr:hypothetical protein [Stellaceae bacterium]
MWREWLARTLNPRRGEKAAAHARKRDVIPLPDLEGDGLHPGADEFRAALNPLETE